MDGTRDAAYYRARACSACVRLYVQAPVSTHTHTDEITRSTHKDRQVHGWLENDAVNSYPFQTDGQTDSSAACLCKEGQAEK